MSLKGFLINLELDAAVHFAGPSLVVAVAVAAANVAVAELAAVAVARAAVAPVSGSDLAQPVSTRLTFQTSAGETPPMVYARWSKAYELRQTSSHLEDRPTDSAPLPRPTLRACCLR